LQIPEAAGPRTAEPSWRLRVEPVDELPVARAAHLWPAADPDQGTGDRVVVRPTVPRLEMEADRERSAVSVVARQKRVPERQECLAFDRGPPDARPGGVEV